MTPDQHRADSSILVIVLQAKSEGREEIYRGGGARGVSCLEGESCAGRYEGPGGSERLDDGA